MVKSVVCPCGGKDKECPDCGGTGVIVLIQDVWQALQDTPSYAERWRDDNPDKGMHDDLMVGWRFLDAE